MTTTTKESRSESDKTRRRATSDRSITMRLSGKTRDLIDNAAATLGKTRTEFVLDSARQTAVDVLLDQLVFDLDAEESAALEHLFANPPPPVATLRALMAARTPWE